MIKNFEEYTRVQTFGNGFSQWRKGHLAHSAQVCVDHAGETRSLVRAAFKAEFGSFGQCFTKQDAKNMGIEL